MKDWIVETRVVSRRVYLVQAEDEKEAIYFSTHVPPEHDEDEFEETMSVVENPNSSLLSRAMEIAKSEGSHWAGAGNKRRSEWIRRAKDGMTSL